MASLLAGDGQLSQLAKLWSQVHAGSQVQAGSQVYEHDLRYTGRHGISSAFHVKQATA